MAKYFFKPRKGLYYDKGLIHGIKVMILGTSHYCTYNEDNKRKNKGFVCNDWRECTSREIRDSSKFNTSCPWYKKLLYEGKISKIVKLEDTSISEINDFLDGVKTNPSYPNFTKFMLDYTGYKDSRDFWEHVLFYNYVQYFVESDTTPCQDKQDIKNFDAFLEIVDKYSPDLIIIWGTQVSNHFKRSYIKKKVEQITWADAPNYGYVLYMEYKGKRYTMINPYHPCDYKDWWSNNLQSFRWELEKVLPKNGNCKLQS